MTEPLTAGSQALLGQPLDVPLAERAVGLLGIASMIGIAYLLSYDRRRVPWRLVLTGLALQGLFGVLVLKTAPGRQFFEVVGRGVTAVLDGVVYGARFAFGFLVDARLPDGIPPGAGPAVFAFQVMPTIIFVSALTSVLYHLGALQAVVKGIAWVMQRTLGTSGAETLSASGNIFLGQTEAPLLIKPFVGTATPSELITIMVGGFATVAGGVLAAYVAFLQPHFGPAIAGHLLAASVMNAPASLLISKVLRPEDRVPVTRGSLKIEVERRDANVIESAANGAATGVQLALNVTGMLIAFMALVYVVNLGVAWLGGLAGVPGLSLERILGTLLRPLTWVMGVPWHDTAYVGSLVGLKTVVNEFVAYFQYSTDLREGVVLAARTKVIAAYALLGFANFSSIAIQIGGIGGLAPERRSEIARYGLRAMIGGNLAAFMSASWAGMLL